jgi:hypothetical protein
MRHLENTPNITSILSSLNLAVLFQTQTLFDNFHALSIVMHILHHLWCHLFPEARDGNRRRPAKFNFTTPDGPDPAPLDKNFPLQYTYPCAGTIPHPYLNLSRVVEMCMSAQLSLWRMVSAERQHLAFRLPSSMCGLVACLCAAWSLGLHVNKESHRRNLEPSTCFTVLTSCLPIVAMCPKGYVACSWTQGPGA